MAVPLTPVSAVSAPLFSVSRCSALHAGLRAAAPCPNSRRAKPARFRASATGGGRWFNFPSLFGSKASAPAPAPSEEEQLPTVTAHALTRRAVRVARSARALAADGASTTPPAAPAEPKWKQKLAAAEAHSAQTRQATLQIQEEYRRRQEAERRQGAAQAAPALTSLPWTAFLTSEGKIADCSDPAAKASVYAIFGEDRELLYVGVSRQVYQSLRLHFARCPEKCHWVKVEHLARPSRATLEGIREKWIAEWGGSVPGNDGGEEQQRWENPVDCKPLMTDEEWRAVEEAAPGPPRARALKAVARRVEAELEGVFAARQCSDVLRFDPKLKEAGLLDLKSTANVPDTSVPKEGPKA